MAARSTGLFPREGFNLDAELEITTSAVAAAVTLKHAKTIRVIVLGAAITGDGDVTVTIGGQSVVILAGDIDANGVAIAHVRGALCDDPANTVEYVANANTGTSAVNGGVFYELVDGAAK